MGNVKIVIFALTLLMLAGCPQEEVSDDSAQLETGEFLPYWKVTWLPICITAIALSALAHGMIYAIGFALNLARVKKYAVSELLQTSATALIVVVLIAALVQAFEYVGGLGSITCGGEEITDPIDADMCRTTELLNTVSERYDYVRDADIAPEQQTSLRISVVGVPVFVGSWMLPNIWKKVETYHSVAYICVNLMIGLSAKLFMLQYIRENMLTVFLPLGIILRTFHFTRGIGAFFISIGIGFFFIYPTVTFIMDSSFSESLDGAGLPEIITTGMCNMPMFGSFSYGSAALAQYGSRSDLASQVSLSKNLSQFVADLQTVLLYNNMVAFALTLTFLRYSTTILGGDVMPFIGMVGRLV